MAGLAPEMVPTPSEMTDTSSAAGDAGPAGLLLEPTPRSAREVQFRSGSPQAGPRKLELGGGAAREVKVRGSRTREDLSVGSAPLVTYGGNFTWVGAHYKMRIKPGLSPLQWLNGLTKRLLFLDDICFHVDGGFRRPGESTPLFPQRGVDLRWRWDAVAGRILIDFSADGKMLSWRWDELKPSEELRFPSTVPDFACVGHVGKFSFEYSLLSAAAECLAEPRAPTPPRRPPEDDAFMPLPGALRREPRGDFEVELPPGPEACREFARLVLCSGPSRRLFLMCPGISEPLPLGEAVGEGGLPEITGSLEPQVAREAMRRFTNHFYETLADVLRPSDLPLLTVLDDVVGRLAANTSAVVGVAFATSRDLLAMFLQPVHIIIGLGKPMEFRVVTYGFVAADPLQVEGERADAKFSPFIVRFLSAELTAAPQHGQGLSVRYAAWSTQDSSTDRVLERETPLLREVIRDAQWSRLF